ncbi:MAG TPA: DSD1 family PLP-dependent enzyme [Vicinamibacteria bacterium]|nr:DSD1 family PLP-dependent enzyme [Vicinamibacteria bacterium]
MPATRREFLAAAVVAPAVVRSPGEKRGREAAGRLTRDEIPTPALLLDLTAFEANVARMAAHLKARGKAFRPHGKTHKCPAIAQALVRAGAVGSCVAKLSEAEVFADHGVGGLLVTTQVVGRRKVARAVALAAEHRETIFVVDDPRSVRDLNDAAGAFGAKPPLRVNLAVDLLYGRTGIAPGEPALELARLIASLPHVRLAGLQAYDGGASHTVGFEERRGRSQASMAQAVETRRRFERDGLECPLLSGGSTGTYNIDSEVDGVTELQPGSFMFMDADYNRIGGREGPVYRDFANALTVLTTVVSRRPDAAIVDGGYKAFSTDRPFTPEAKGIPGIAYAWAGDEHGRLDLTNAFAEVKLGDRIEFVVPHCDPTVNLYDRLYGLRGDRVEAVWPIAARGMSQ